MPRDNEPKSETIFYGTYYQIENFDEESLQVVVLHEADHATTLVMWRFGQKQLHHTG